MNIYKKTIVSAFAIAIGTICISEFTSTAHSNAGGAPMAKTGSPGDGSNCTGCHTGTASSSGGSITSNVPVTGYIPGDTYTITATITVSGINKFGFEISPQGTTSTQKGTLIATDAINTKLLGMTGKYITHKTAGTAGTGTKTWTFNWTAPIAGSGNAILYGAFVAANANGTNTGDQVFLTSLLIQENLSAGIMDIVNNADSWNVYPNPSTDRINIESLDANAEMKSLEMYDITGKLIKSFSYETISQSQSIDIANLQSGVYVLNIQTDKNRVTKKFVKQ